MMNRLKFLQNIQFIFQSHFSFSKYVKANKLQLWEEVSQIWIKNTLGIYGRTNKTFVVYYAQYECIHSQIT